MTMRERLSELEHKQWVHWTAYMLDNLTPENIERWRQQIETPYSDLSEKEKKSDRAWADKVLDALAEPTEAMVMIADELKLHAAYGRSGSFGALISRTEIYREWQAMIDAAGK